MILRVRRVLETAVYCDNLTATVNFYKTLLALEPMRASERVVSFDAGEGTVLLLFQRGVCNEPSDGPGGLVPGHVGTGPAHFAFAIDTEDVGAWIERLTALGVPIESRVQWALGGQSIYFRDPDGHAVELATPGTWPCY